MFLTPRSCCYRQCAPYRFWSHGSAASRLGGSAGRSGLPKPPAARAAAVSVANPPAANIVRRERFSFIISLAISTKAAKGCVWGSFITPRLAVLVSPTMRRWSVRRSCSCSCPWLQLRQFTKNRVDQLKAPSRKCSRRRRICGPRTGRDRVLAIRGSWSAKNTTPGSRSFAHSLGGRLKDRDQPKSVRAR